MTDQESVNEVQEEEVDAIVEKFPGVALPDDRQGFDGYLVPADKLIDFAAKIKNDLGYDYLSSVTGVDYMPEEKMEVVYHAYQTSGGPPLCLRSRLSGTSRKFHHWFRSIRVLIFKSGKHGTY